MAQDRLRWREIMNVQHTLYVILTGMYPAVPRSPSEMNPLF